MERYEEWDVSIPPIPPRRRLYRLEPIGIGTPYVESLTSYVARLAEMHCILPKALIMGEILPFLGRQCVTSRHYSRLNSFWNKDAQGLNGIGPLAKDWVDALQMLTMRDDLSFLTMLMWSEPIANDKLLRLRKAWCPHCYQDWRRASQDIYEPLLWALNGIEICSRHCRPLVDRCPHCQEMIPFLTQISRPGYCSHCTSWLGSSCELNTLERLPLVALGFKRQLWIAEVAGDLLSAVSNLSSPPTKARVAEAMSFCLNTYARGNLSALARLLDVTVQSLWGYLRKGSVPYFKTLLSICYSLSITPLELLTANPIWPQSAPKFVIDQLPVIDSVRQKPLSEEDFQGIRRVLEAVLGEAKEPFPNLKEVALRLGCTVAILRKYCPDLCKAISIRYRQSWTEETHERVRHKLENALNSIEPVSLSTVARLVGFSSDVLRKHFPNLCESLVLQYRRRFGFDYEKIEQQLQEVLISSEDVPSVCELSRQIGRKPSFLRNKFPDLCRQLAEKRRRERRRRKDERLMSLHEEIRQVMRTLHQQSVYPSSNRVRKLLSDPNAMRRSEGCETWRTMLKQLGYQADK